MATAAAEAARERARTRATRARTTRANSQYGDKSKDNRTRKPKATHTRHNKERGKQEQQKEHDLASKKLNEEGNKHKQNGYMSSRGKPRQPRTTHENKDGTLRYERETNTWKCTRCGKNYSGRNARSAQIHAEAHTRAEKQQREEQGGNIIHHYTHQNQGKVRIRTLGNYGSDHRCRESGESQKNDGETSSTSRSQK